MDTSIVFRTLFALTLLTLPSAATAQTDSSQTSDSESEEPDTESSSDSPAEESDSDEGDSPEESDSESDAEQQEETGSEEGGADEEPEVSDDPPAESTDDEPADTEGDEQKEPSDDQEAESTGEDSPSEPESGEDEAADSDRKPSEKDEGEKEEGDAKTAPPPKPPKQSEESKQQEGEESPISDLAESSKEKGFEPVEDIEESSLQEITPAEVYPYLEWDGLYRVRTDAAVNFDLDTEGTSAVLPPLETYRPSPDNPAKPGNELLWGADTELRLDPTLHISEMLRVHMEAGILDNLVFGSLSDARLTRPGSTRRPDPTRSVFDSNQLSPREREWFENALRINELWGEIDTFVGTLRAGRMDDHWGVGMFANSGDCPDCDFGDHVDRIQFRTKPLDLAYLSAAIDFPDQGVTSQAPGQQDGQPRDLSHIDDARQYTFSVFRSPRSKKERKVEQQKLKEQKLPVFNGGARFTYRNQKGLFVPSRSQTEPTPGNEVPGTLIYRGLNLYVPDVWGKVLYNPAPDTFVRVELEAAGVFGDVDNASRKPVGGTSEGETVNCFTENDRQANPDECVSNSQGISQFGFALESEMYFGGPVRFGLNGGYASGGNAPNWGYGASDGSQHQFFRFDPNYHVDLILFREVIGTVTNAYYANPYAQARFFESPDQRMEVQLDGIISRASNLEGTPAGPDSDGWLGLELDAAVRYLQIDQFEAELEGGVLFPFSALNANLGRERLTQPGGVPSNFDDNTSATIPWTIQANMMWKF